MKYPEHKLSMETALPSSVQSWLGNELEIRGIDSVIYSRYIIHLLLEDQEEDGTDYIELLFNPRLDVVKSKFKHQRRSHSQEERRKQAAVECLQAITDEKCGIEKLVEELSYKLKELSQSSGSDDTDQGESTPSFSDGSCSELEDPAERYYAAFPALSVQNEKSPITDNCQQTADIWKDNPWTKSAPDKDGKVNKEKKKKKEDKKYKKRSPKSTNTKRKTLEKPIPKPKTKPKESFHTRFMSWPQADYIASNKQSTEEKKLCQQVENILKDMLLNGKDQKSRYSYNSEGCVSPELQENAFWYTPQFADMFNPVEQSHRLYERHSCPFFYHDEVFVEPEEIQEDDKFGLQDLMKNQELQNVAESVLQNVDEDFSKKDSEAELQEVIQPNFSYSLYQDLNCLLPAEEEKQMLSPYDNTIEEHEILENTTCQWSLADPEDDLLTRDHPLDYTGYDVDHPRNMPAMYDDQTNYSQLWDINIWNKVHSQKPCFLEGFNTSFDEFKSGLPQIHERGSNRNSGIFNISKFNDDMEAVYEGEITNTLIPKITFDAVDFECPEDQKQDINYSSHHKVYDRSISLTDVCLLKSMKDGQLTSNDKLSKSFELVPSNNSAFKDVIPRRISHVLSDSNISYFNYTTDINFEEETEDEKEDAKNENLFLSPKTHFRPISTCGEDVVSEPRDLFGGYLSSKTPYQKYQDTVDSGDEELFVPMFKVCKQHNKNIQTGTSMGEQTGEPMSTEDQGRPPEIDDDLEMPQDFDVYGYVDSLTASAQNTPLNLLDVACTTCFDSGYEEANDEEKVSEDKNVHAIENQNAEWSNPSTEDRVDLIDDHDFWIVTDKTSEISDNIWSSHDENNFPDMFSFFMEDCDDLKQGFDEQYDNHQYPAPQGDDVDNVTKVKLVIGKGKKVLQDIENYPRESSTTEGQITPVHMKGYKPMPSVAVYSCELEKKWLDKGSMQSYAKNKSVKGTGRKPCTFFMEGSCKRSDCKFSHDLSSITCRFWQEGDCFKGELCPFLHGYQACVTPTESKENIDDLFQLQDEEFPQLTPSVKNKKSRPPRPERTNSYAESRKIYRSTKQKSISKSID